MEKIFVFFFVIIIIATFGYNVIKASKTPSEIINPNTNFPPQSVIKNVIAFEGDYMGQEKPGIMPKVFAPGIISTDNYEFACTFAPDGKEFYFTRRQGQIDNRILYMKQQDNGWTSPTLAPFAANYFEFEPFITPDGKKLFFGSERPFPGKRIDDTPIWVVERTVSGWSDPVKMEAPINDIPAMYISVTNDGSLYFTSYGMILKSKYVNGKYEQPEKVPQEINFSKGVAHSYIAPDESYILYDYQPPLSPGKPRGKRAIYINFREKNNSWSKAKKLPESINAVGTEMCPYVSPDGKYLFFCRQGDIYWVSINILDTLR